MERALQANVKITGKRAGGSTSCVLVVAMLGCAPDRSEQTSGNMQAITSPAGLNLPDDRRRIITPYVPRRSGPDSLCPDDAEEEAGDRWFICDHTVGLVLDDDHFNAKWPNGTDGLPESMWIAAQNVRIVAIHGALTHTQELLYFSGDGYDVENHRAGLLSHYGLFDTATYRVRGVAPPPRRDLGAPYSIADLFCAGHATLETGRVLAAGGMGYRSTAPGGELEGYAANWGAAGYGAHAGHFIGGFQSVSYDPILRTWRQEGDLIPEVSETGAVMNEEGGGRWYPSLVELPDGRVSAHWGHPSTDDSRHSNNTAEVFSPGSAQTPWVYLGFEPDQAQRVNADVTVSTSGPTYPRMHLLPNGLVFRAQPTAHRSEVVAENNDWERRLNSVLDANMASSRRGTEFVTHVADAAPFGPTTVYNPGDNNTHWSSVLLPLVPSQGIDASVLVTGEAESLIIDLSTQQLQSVSGRGGDAYSADPSDAPDPAELLQWTNTAPRETPTGASNPPRRRHATLTLLPSGEVLMTGGSARIADPPSQWCRSPQLRQARRTLRSFHGYLAQRRGSDHRARIPLGRGPVA